MMLPFIFFSMICFSNLYANDDTNIEQWTKHRITEMFDLSSDHHDDSIANYFTKDAWQSFQSALEASMINEYLSKDQYSVLLDHFVKPVSISPAPKGKLYAQTTFMLKFANTTSSWLQPMEMIITLDKSSNSLKITNFEAIASLYIFFSQLFLT